MNGYVRKSPVLARVRATLEEARREGEPFEVAWDRSQARSQHIGYETWRSWRDALADTKCAWMAAYYGLPQDNGMTHLRAALDALDNPEAERPQTFGTRTASTAI